MNKLETVEDVLAWAYDVRQHEDERFAEDLPHAEDRATAAEIARAMRLLRAFGELENDKSIASQLREDPWDGTNHESDFDRLRAALEEPKP